MKRSCCLCSSLGSLTHGPEKRKKKLKYNTSGIVKINFKKSKKTQKPKKNEIKEVLIMSNEEKKKFWGDKKGKNLFVKIKIVIIATKK